jgi:UDP-N-acetylglucosamine 1-carboxyvinyltransferase
MGALCAEGDSQVYDIGHVERGYEDFVGKLRGLGADVELLDP